MLIGLSRREITSPSGTPLVGYGDRISEDSEMPLLAEAMACRGGNGSWMLITCDLLGVTQSLVAEIRATVAAACPVDPSGIMVSVTHTHSGPDAVGRRPDELPEATRKWRRELVRTIRELALEAWSGARRSEFASVEMEVPGIVHNRRLPGSGCDTWINEWWDPEGNHTGPVDCLLQVLAIREPAGRIRGLLVGYPCHPVTLGPQSLSTSPDYPGYIKKVLQEALDLEYTAFCLPGCGQLNPRNCILETTDEARRIGSVLADAVTGSLDSLSPVVSGPVSHARSTWTLAPSIIRPKVKFMDNGKEEIRTEFQALKAGGLAILAAPGELFFEYNSWIRAGSDYPCTMISSISNDYIGYLPTDQAMKEGSYEVEMAPAARVQEEILAHCRRLLTRQR